MKKILFESGNLFTVLWGIIGIHGDGLCEDRLQ